MKKMLHETEKKLMRTGIFKNRVDMALFLLAKNIGKQNEPVGSWALKADFDNQGFIYSTATIGRYLKMLDSKEYTRLCGNQGRVLTPGGMVWLNSMEERLARARMRDEASQEIQVNEYAELIDLFQARKTIEIEAARLAAINASAEEISHLKGSIAMHYQYVAENRDPIDPALDFHAIVSEISHNKFIKAMLSMLIFEEKQIESSMEILVTRERGSLYVVEHDKIMQAIEKRDGKLAAELMDAHLDAIRSAVIEQVQEFKDAK